MIKIKLLFFLIILVLWDNASMAQCYGPNESLRTTGEMYIDDQVRDVYGNLYVFATYFGRTTIEGRSYISEFGNSVLIKFDQNGVFVWDLLILGLDGAVFSDHLILDNNNDIIISGLYYSSTIDIDCITLKNKGRDELFMAKVAKEGQLVWAKSSEGSTLKSVGDLKVDYENNIILSGQFVGGRSFSFDTLNTNGVGGLDMFIAKFSNDGTGIWIRSFGGTDSYDYVEGMTVDNEGDVIITGTFNGNNINFDGTIYNPRIRSANYFIAKLSSNNGGVEWVKTTDTPSITRGMSIVTDDDDNIYTTGSYNEHDFEIDGNVLTHQGDGDVFVIKYDPSGDYLWGRSIQGDGFENASDIIYFNQEHLSVSAYYYSAELTLGASTLHNMDRPANAVIAELDSDGNFNCYLDFADSEENLVWWIRYDSLGNLYTNTSLDFLPYKLTIYGDKASWVNESESISDFSIDLGDDIILCERDSIVLSLNLPTSCSSNNSIIWSDGSHGSMLTVREEGRFWVSVMVDGTIYSDTIKVAYFPPFEPLPFEDINLCTDDELQIDVSDSLANSFQSNLGNDITLLTVNQPGNYWVIRSNDCYSIMDTFSVKQVKPLMVDLGKDTVLCRRDFNLTLNAANTESTYQWNTGEITPSIDVVSPGQYVVQVSNGCETIEDEIKVSQSLVDGLFVPNVITPNGDNDNETFKLSEDVLPLEITIYNRWGNAVYENPHYDNSWDGSGLVTGIYYYRIKGDCLTDGINGEVHVLK